MRRGKTFAAEQKICELKKFFLRSKRMQKLQGKRVKSNEQIKKVTVNLNDIKSPKNGYLSQKVGVLGTLFTKVNFECWLSNAEIKHFSFNYHFYDMEKQKIRDCAYIHLIIIFQKGVLDLSFKITFTSLD